MAVEGQRIMKYLRWASGMTQQALADKAGLSARSLRSVEKGQARPRARTRAAIAHALGVEPDDVFPPAAQ